jgi:hypothetical protein
MLKRMLLTLTALTMALTLSLGMLATADSAGAAPESPGSSRPAVEVCQSPEVQEEIAFLGITMGECVNVVAGLITENNSRFITGLCGVAFLREEMGFANKGQCISTLQAQIRAE